MALRFGPRDEMSFWFYFRCRLMAALARRMSFMYLQVVDIGEGARGVVGMVILTEDEGRDASFLSVMEFHEVYRGDARKLGFMAAALVSQGSWQRRDWVALLCDLGVQKLEFFPDFVVSELQGRRWCPHGDLKGVLDFPRHFNPKCN
ncbi:hypothetical protein V8G54_030800 [Vigna mungo]|uniref:Uncharacterized protein n=1 Tax=Vigna mungo TaxID=3915 RepID=A0AAQ3MVT1_VIGMU